MLRMVDKVICMIEWDNIIALTIVKVEAIT